MSLDIARIRAEFPALAITDSGRKRIYFDSPGGTQTPKSVIDRTVDCLVRSNANLGGPFATSIAAGKLVEEAHAAMADMLGAASPSRDRLRPEHDDPHPPYLALHRADPGAGR